MSDTITFAKATIIGLLAELLAFFFAPIEQQLQKKAQCNVQQVCKSEYLMLDYYNLI